MLIYCKIHFKGFKHMKKFLVISACITLASCSAIYNRTYNSDLKISTKMSQNLTLDPVPDDQKTYWLEVKNTSDNPSFNIRNEILNTLATRGYKSVNNPKVAHYWLQANILRAEKVSDASEERFNQSIIQGGLAGGVASGLAGRGNGGIIALGALGGAALGALLDYDSQNIKYAVLVDLVVSEKIENGSATEDSSQTIGSGNSGSKVITSKRNLDRNKYNVKILSTAEKVNLTIQEATSEMQKAISSAIGNVI